MTTLTEQAVIAAMEGTEGVTPGPWEVVDKRVVNPKGDAELGTWTVAKVWWDVNREHIQRCSPEFIRALCEDWLRQREALEKVDRIAKVPFGTFNHISQVASAALSPLPEETKPS